MASVLPWDTCQAWTGCGTPLVPGTNREHVLFQGIVLGGILHILAFWPPLSAWSGAAIHTGTSDRLHATPDRTIHFPFSGFLRCTDSLVVAGRNRSRGKDLQMAQSDVLQPKLKRFLDFFRRQTMLKEHMA